MNRGRHSAYKLRGMQSAELECGKGSWVPNYVDDTFRTLNFSLVDQDIYRIPSGSELLLIPRLYLEMSLGVLTTFASYEAAG